MPPRKGAPLTGSSHPLQRLLFVLLLALLGVAGLARAAEDFLEP